MSWHARRAFIVLPVLVTLVLATSIGVLAVVQNQRQTDQEAMAQTVGEDYLSNVATFRLNATRKIRAVVAEHTASAAKLERVVTDAMENPPRLPAVSGYGREHAAAYRQAQQTASSLLTPYRHLKSTLLRAETSETFIAAARKVLALKATDYIGYGLISSSAKVRSSLIPEFSKARDKFAAVEVPASQKDLAAKVRDAAQYVINQSTILADRIDARQNFSFRYDQQFQAATDSVEGYATEVQGDVEEAIQTATNLT